MTAEMSIQRPDWVRAEPVGSDPRPKFRRRRAFGALVATCVTIAPWSSTRADGTPRAATSASVAAPVPLDAFPVDAPCYFGDTFGAPRPPDRVHEGIDIGASEGTPVRAVKTATVIQLYQDFPSSRAGNAVKIATDDGSYFFYAHLSRVEDGISVGTPVSAGQVIGYVGHTGNAGTVNHLHFEMHPRGGGAVNPYAELRAIDACRAPKTGVSVNTVPPPTAAPSTAATTTLPRATRATTTTVGDPSTPVADSAAATTPPAPTTPPAGQAPATTAEPARSPSTPTSTVPSPTPSIVVDNVSPSKAALLTLTNPTRVVNSAAGVGSKARSGRTNTYRVTGVRSVPESASLVMLKVYALSPGSSGSLTVMPCDSSGSGASTAQFRAGFMDGTSTLIKPIDGNVCLTTTASTQVVIDVVGYDGAWSAGVTPIRPTRLLEQTTMQPNEPISLRGSNVGGIPPSNGVTATISFEKASAAGHLWVYACDKSKPSTAQVIVGGGPGSASVNTRLSADGNLCMVSDVRVKVIVDVSAAWALGGSNKLKAVSPVRAYDSADEGKQVAAGRVLTLWIANDELPWNASVVSVVITGSGARSDGFITAWPCGQSQPGTAAVSVARNRTASNSSIVGLGNGKLCVSPSVDMDITVDVNGGA